MLAISKAAGRAAFLALAAAFLAACGAQDNNAADLAAAFSYTPASPETGQVVQFTDTSTGSPTSWGWNFGDGVTDTARNPGHVFGAAGSYTVTLTVSNASSSKSTTRAVTVTTPPQTAAFTYSPSSPVEGQPVQFTDASTSGPVSWQWNFSDGATDAAQNPSHTFESPASYTVTLTVGYGSGTSTVSRTITVLKLSEIFPPERLIDWSGAGVYANGVKGIPVYPVGVNAKNAPYNAKGDGVTDDTAAIRAAVTACPAGQAVLLPQGTYKISGTISIGKGIVVRGEGPDKTRVIQYASSHIFRISGSSASSVTDVLTGYEKGSDTITVAGGSAFRAGDVVSIDELNDPSLVTSTGTGGTCRWCGRYGVNGTRAMGETKLVAAVVGNTVRFVRPLHFTYKAELLPQLVRLSGSPVRNAGIEALYMESADGTTDGHSVFMAGCVYCWVKGVESANTSKKHVELQYGTYGNEVRDSYFHDAKSFTSDRGYGVNVSLGSSDNLIENNVLYHLHYAVALEAGGAGNVIAYNYQERTEHYERDWFIQSMGTHGAHSYMNLWEGNVAGMIDFDNYWGSGSHQVVFRNHLTRENPGEPVDANLIAAIVDANNYYDTFVGNILGTPGCPGVVEQIPYVDSYMNPVLWKIGYNCCSATGYPSDATTGATLVRHGNYDYVTNGLTWAPNIPDHNLPDSLYLSSKPAWFGSLTWPPFAAERPGFNPAVLNKIPAQVRFESLSPANR